MAQQRYYTELDSLRGFASMGVVLYHFITPFFFWCWSCVDLFFVLSGFLITTIIINNVNKPHFFKAFYIRRALRIWPVYFLILITLCSVYTIAVLFFNEPFITPSGIPLYFVFLQYIDFYFIKEGATYFYYFHSFQQSWSLAVEEQFYLFWPIIYFLLRPSFFKMLISTIILSGIAIYMASIGFDSSLLLVKSHGLLLGILLAYLFNMPDRDGFGWILKGRLKIFILAILVGLLIVVPYLVKGYTVFFDENMHQHGVSYLSLAFSMIYFGVIGLCVLYSGHDYLKILRYKPFLWLGSISYGLYMYHLVVYAALEMFLKTCGMYNGYVLILLSFILSLLISHFSYQFMEKRFLELRGRYSYGVIKK